MKRFLSLLAVAVLTLTDGMAAQDKLPHIEITTTTPLETGMGFFPGAGAQQKVSAHLKTEGYDGPIGIKIRGNSSKAFNQKKYTIETRDENGKDLDVSLLGMPAHSKWVLLAPYNDVSMVRDPLAFQLWHDMGHWAPRTVMCEVTVDGQYRGIYILCEAIKRGKDRVDIAKMKKSDTEGREVTGGYLLRIDTADENDFTFTSKLPGIGEGIMSSDVIWSCIYPKKEKLQPAQSAYIVSYVDTVEQVIQSDAFADPAKGYAHYIDVASFVDYFIHTELSLNADAYRRSAYFYKEKQKADGTGGKLFAGPVWDYNYAYGNSNLANADKPDSWCYEGSNNNPTPAMWQRLLQDPKFRKAVKQRYQELRKSVLSNKTINAYIDRQVKLLSQAQAHHFATYPELLVNEAQKQQFEERKQKDPMSGFGGFPFGGGMIPEGMPQGGMPSMVDLFAAYRVSSYDEEISVLKAWLANRLAFLDRNIARFDRDWEPRIQPLIEKKMQFPGFPSGGF